MDNTHGSVQKKTATSMESGPTTKKLDVVMSN